MVEKTLKEFSQLRYTALSPRCSTRVPTPLFQYEDAEFLFRRAMEIAEGTVGKDYSECSIMQRNLTGLLEKQVRASM